MMNTRLFLLFILATPALLTAQDWNWYIHDGMGMIEQQDSGIYVYDNLINTSTLRLYGEQAASTSPISRNDIFIIFNDSACYSSRIHPRIRNQGGNTVFSTFPGADLYIQTPGRGARYLYWTNVYDTDDPPPMDFNVSATTQGGDVSNTVQVDGMIVDAMFAHQDIVAGKDIILVIPRSKEIRTLQYNRIGNNTVPVMAPNTAIFPEGNIAFGESVVPGPDSNTLLIKPSKNPVYLAFKVSTQLVAYIDSTHTWTLLDENQEVLDTYHEKILGSHDPNFVYLYRICRDGDAYYANYMVHFHNDGTGPVNTVDFSFDNNNDFVRIRQEGVQSLGGRFGNGTYQCCENLFWKRQGDWFTSTFRPNRVSYRYRKAGAGILPGRTSEQQLHEITEIIPGSTGYFIVCLRLKRGLVNRGLETMQYRDLMLRNPRVYFDGQGFDVTTFIPHDHGNKKKNYIRTIADCGRCNCDNACIPIVMPE
jgi:hypothetical protein